MIVSRKPSTEHALKGITKALDELDAVVAMEQAEINAKLEESGRLLAEVKEGEVRRDRAKTIAERFAALVA